MKNEMNSSFKYSEGDLFDGRWRLKRAINRGAMGEIWRAKDESGRGAESEYILKIFSPIHPKTKDTLTGKERADSYQYFKREIRINQILSDTTFRDKLGYKRVVEYFDATAQSDTPWLAMQYYRETFSLGEIEKLKHFSLNKRISVLKQVAEGLDYIHQRGIIHRDIKPENILTNTAGEAHVIDLGLARFIEIPPNELDEDSQQTTLDVSGIQNVSRAGTPNYLSPGRLIDKPASPQSDLYAFVLTVYEVLCGGAKVFEEKRNNHKIQFSPVRLTWQKAPSTALKGKLSHPLSRNSLNELDELFAEALIEFSGIDEETRSSIRFGTALGFISQLAKLIPPDEETENEPRPLSLAASATSQLAASVISYLPHLLSTALNGSANKRWQARAIIFSLVVVLAVIIMTVIIMTQGNEEPTVASITQTSTETPLNRTEIFETALAAVIQTVTDTPQSTSTIEATRTATPSETATVIPTETATLSQTPTSSPTYTTTASLTPSLTSTATLRPTETFTPTLTASPTSSLTLTPTATFTATITLSPTIPTDTPTLTLSPDMQQTFAAQATLEAEATLSAVHGLMDTPDKVITLIEEMRRGAFNCELYLQITNFVNTPERETIFQKLQTILSNEDATNLYEFCVDPQNAINESVQLLPSQERALANLKRDLDTLSQ